MRVRVRVSCVGDSHRFVLLFKIQRDRGSPGKVTNSKITGCNLDGLRPDYLNLENDLLRLLSRHNG